MGRYKLRTTNTIAFFIDGNLNAQRYSNEILRPIVVPFIRHHHLMFQHDNAQPHVTRIYTQFLKAENVPVLAYILTRNVWDALDQHVRQRAPVPATIQQLRTALEEEWDNIHRPQSTT
jgi:hypothetical protein